MEKSFGLNFHMGQKLYEQTIMPVAEKYDLTKIEVDIILFLANNPGWDSAKDIVSKRLLTKSHVSTALNYLEKNGYIRREFRNGNNKTAHLILLEKANDVIHDGRSAQKEFTETLSDGLDLDEAKIIFDKIFDNIAKALKQEEKKKC